MTEPLAAFEQNGGDKKPFWDKESGRSYKSPYEMWKAQEGLPTLRGWGVDNLYTLELHPWETRGGSGIFINLEGSEGFTDSYVCEIPPGKSLKPIRHIYEDTVFILKGHGATTVWTDESKKVTFEWADRSYFAIPPNAWYQHHNGSGSEPARYVGMTAAPRVINTFKDLDFVFNNPYVFKDRFKGEKDYFKTQSPTTGEGKVNLKLVTNFVADVREVTPRGDDPKGVGPRGPRRSNVIFDLVNNTMRSHSAEWPVGTYMNAHRHGPGLHIIILTSRGYSLMWPEGGPVIRVDYGPGSIFVPPEMWWHQHFNTGPEPLLHLAVGWGSEKPKRGGGAYVYQARNERGEVVLTGEDVITLEQEDPHVHRDFEVDLAKGGIPCNMGHVHPRCSQRPA